MIRYSGYWGRQGYSRVIEVSQNSFSGSFCSLVVFMSCVSRMYVCLYLRSQYIIFRDVFEEIDEEIIVISSWKDVLQEN